MPSRRQVLALLAALPVVLGLPEDARAAEPDVTAGPDWDDTDIAVLKGVLAAVYGPNSERCDAVEALTASFAWLDGERKTLIRMLPSLFDQASRVLVPTIAAFHDLDPAQQQACVDDWAASPLAFRRQIFGALRQLLLAHAYADPATWADIAYPGPWIGRYELPIHPLRFGDPELP